jgi:secreted PhoX family phosphatase
MVNTADLSAYATKKGLNAPQNLNNMVFKLPAPAGGQPVTQVYVRYSGAIYNRWDYDPTSGTYLRFSDAMDANNGVAQEQYAQLTDRLTNQPITFDNVVVLYVNHELYSPNIYDIQLIGSGDAYAFRDGQAYKVKWVRNVTDVVSLTNPDGSPLANRPELAFHPFYALIIVVGATGLSALYF